MRAIPHPTIKDMDGNSVLLDIESSVTDRKISYRLKLDILENIRFDMMSPETGALKQPVTITKEKKALRTGKCIVYDPQAVRITNDAEANALLRQPYHNGWKVLFLELGKVFRVMHCRSQEND